MYTFFKKIAFSMSIAPKKSVEHATMSFNNSRYVSCLSVFFFMFQLNSNNFKVFNI